MSSYKLISNSFTDRTKIINLNNNNDLSIDNLSLSKYYIGNFDIYKINTSGTFDIQKSNNRVIEVFRIKNVIGYFFRGIYNELTNEIISQPDSNIENIGYLSLDNNNIVGYIRASEKAGKGSFEKWEFDSSGEIIKSFYSINSGDDNRPVLWIGEFKKINLD